MKFLDSYFGWLATINAGGRACHGPVCDFLVFWLQITIAPFALFHHSVYDNMCFTAMFHR